MMNRRSFLALAASAGTLLPALPAHAGWRDLLRDGSVVVLDCLGDIRTRYRFLDGRTRDGTVGLAPEAGGRFSGALWRVARLEDDVIGLACQGNVPGLVWLDGRTREGTVGLAPQTGGGYTGTRWRVQTAGGPDVVVLRCLGHLPGKRWLDGRTRDGSVGLAPQAAPPFSGTRWRISRV